MVTGPSRFVAFATEFQDWLTGSSWDVFVVSCHCRYLAPKGPLHLELGRRRKETVFCMFYIEIIIILFLHKKCIEIVQLPHVLHAKNVQKMYFESTAQKPFIHVIRVVQCFLHVFHNVSMHFQCENSTNPSINVICVKKTRTLLSYQVRDVVPMGYKSVFWAASLGLLLFLDFWKLFLDMRLGIRFAGVQIS
jgi:hypothetical protein